jgi:hypothetical protein
LHQNLPFAIQLGALEYLRGRRTGARGNCRFRCKFFDRISWRAIVKQTVTAALSAALLFLASASQADAPTTPPAPPDPAKLSVPPLPLPFIEKDRQDSDSRYYFQKDGVSYQNAFADFQLCSQYSGTVVLVAKPRDYVPLGTDLVATDTSEDAAPQVIPPYGGLVGALLFDAFVAPEINASAMRLCMSYRGYKRYAVSSAAYREITRGNDTEEMARQAIVASGPAPQGGDVGP